MDLDPGWLLKLADNQLQEEELKGEKLSRLNF